MKKPTHNLNLLTQAILASTLFASPFAFATVYGPGTTAGPVSVTAQGGTVEVLGGPAATAGQITGSAGAGSNAINQDFAGGVVKIDSNNQVYGVDAVYVTGVAGAPVYGVDFTASGTLTVGAGSGINNASTGAFATDAVVVNAGAVAVINNFGTIQATGGIGALTNKGSAIEVTGALASATITNSVGAVISGNSTIVAPALGVGATIVIDANVTGGTTTISNSGIIRATGTGGAITSNANIAGITNTASGTIASTTPLVGAVPGATINTTTAGTTITNGLVNYGNIIVDAFGAYTFGANTTASAIDFQTVTTNAVVTQNGGLISGNVALAKFDASGVTANTFVMNGGTIAGNVNAGATAGTNLVVNGGMITGVVLLGANGQIFSMSGGNVLQLAGGAGADTYNFTGGTVQEITTGNGGADIMNVGINSAGAGAVGTFTGNIINGIPTINVVTAGSVFTANGPITNLNTALNVNAGTTMIVNAPISGTAGGAIAYANAGTMEINTLVNPNTGAGTSAFVNTGTLEIGSEGELRVSTFANNGTSVYEPILYPQNNYGQIVVTGGAGAANFAATSFINPYLVPGQFFPQGSRFDIVSAVGAGGTITGVPGENLVQPQSVILSVTQAIIGAAGAPQTLSIVVNRNSYQSQSSSQQTAGVAATLDNLAGLNGGTGPTSHSLLTLLGQLDFDPTQAALNADMASLTPDANYGLVMGAQTGMKQVFNTLVTRMGDMRMFAGNERLASNAPYQQVASNGLSYGDGSFSDIGVWGEVLGAHLNQKSRDSVNGYKANAAGLAIGADWSYSDCALVGLAASYSKTNVDGKGQGPKDQAIKSWQGTIYGWYEPTESIFMDGMFAIAGQHINSNRVITANTITLGANASYDGTLYGLLGDIGYALLDCDEYYVAPFIRLAYNHLDLDSYQEDGAYGLNLSVSGQDLNEFSGGIGIRLAAETESRGVRYVPEFAAIVSYDFTVDAEQTTANFIGGGIAFGTNGVIPGRTIVDFELGLNAYLNPCSVFTIQYDLELRDEYVGNAGFIKYYYRWS